MGVELEVPYCGKVAMWQCGKVAICCAYDSPTLTAGNET